jgi:hypothetical protein
MIARYAERSRLGKLDCLANRIIRISHYRCSSESDAEPDQDGAEPERGENSVSDQTDADPTCNDARGDAWDEWDMTRSCPDP